MKHFILFTLLLFLVSCGGGNDTAQQTQETAKESYAPPTVYYIYRIDLEGNVLSKDESVGLPALRRYSPFGFYYEWKDTKGAEHKRFSGVGPAWNHDGTRYFYHRNPFMLLLTPQEINTVGTPNLYGSGNASKLEVKYQGETIFWSKVLQSNFKRYHPNDSWYTFDVSWKNITDWDFYMILPPDADLEITVSPPGVYEEQ